MGLGLGPGVAAALALAVVLVPRFVRATDLALDSVDPRLRSAAEALGASPWDALRTLVLPAARPALVARGLREVARGVGEAAPLILLGAVEPLGHRALSEPAAALTLVLLVLAANAHAVWRRPRP